MTGPDLLFVYGTLRPASDDPMAERLRDAATHLGAATWRGRLYDLGAFPAAVRQAGHFRVHGDLFRIRPSDALWEHLDAHESLVGESGYDGDFARVLSEVRLEDGTSASAWVYVYTGRVRRSTWIPSGDWQRHVRDGSRPHHSARGLQNPP